MSVKFQKCDLEKLYSNKTIKEISNIYKVSYTCIRNHLIKFGIQIRNCHHTVRIKLEQPVELESKEWLYEQYIVNKISLNNIAKILNIKRNGVRSALIRHKIKIRTKAEGQRIRHNIQDNFIFNESVLNGCLLGDGFLARTGMSDDSYPYFAKRNIYLDHVKFVGQQIFSKDVDKRIAFCYKGNPIYKLSTVGHKELLNLYKQWYPEDNNFIKLIPKSIKIDEILLLHWFLDDGYSYWAKQKQYRYLRVQFATQSFSKDCLDMLCEKIFQKFGLKMYPRFHQRHGKIKGTGFHVELSQANNEDFFNIIGSCPVPSLGYKWKMPNF